MEDEKPFNTVRRLVQQEDYDLRLMRDHGLPSPTPYDFVELPPDREYLLVTEFFDGAVELGEAQVDDDVIDDGLSIIRRLWDAGLAHRDIKPANLLVGDGRLLLIDVAFAEARPSPWRQAVDLHNMMAVPGASLQPRAGYRRALRQFTEEEITEAFARSRCPVSSTRPGSPLGWRYRPSCARCCARRAVSCIPSSSSCCPARRRQSGSSDGASAGSGCGRRLCCCWSWSP
jgi:tRNA A-37 threonylcarbamoyl transferase component Bud32